MRFNGVIESHITDCGGLNIAFPDLKKQYTSY